MRLQIDAHDGEYHVSDDQHVASGRGPSLRAALNTWLEQWQEQVTKRVLQDEATARMAGTVKAKSQG